MFYYLFTQLQESGFPGVRLMDYITFRSGAAFVLAMLIAVFVGRIGCRWASLSATLTLKAR